MESVITSPVLPANASQLPLPPKGVKASDIAGVVVFNNAGNAVAPADGIYLAYLEAWQRHLTPLDLPVNDTSMREAALGGPDTCTREKTVWQVKLLRAGDPDTELTCLSEIAAWKTLTATADGRLAARAEASVPPKTPCQLPPEAGYRLLENHLYRVEIHDDGTVTGKARYKWSRDNGSILSRVVRWLDDPIATEFEVASIGRDDVLAISAGIWLFMRGGVSHMESFDPKPMLTKYAGKTIGETPYASVHDPEKLKKVRVVVVNDANGKQRNVIYPLQVGYKRYGHRGIENSDWFPHIGSCADEIAFIRGMWTTADNHGAEVQVHSGRHMLEPRVPTLGAWVTYGLGSENRDLPSYVVLLSGPPGGAGTTLWSTGFLPSVYQGIQFRGSGSYTNINGATSASRLQSQTAAKWYRCKVTCDNTGAVTESGPIFIDMKPFYSCYCVSYALNPEDTKIDTVKIGNMIAGSSPTNCETYTDNTALNLDVDKTFPVSIKIDNGA